MQLNQTNLMFCHVLTVRLPIQQAITWQSDGLMSSTLGHAIQDRMSFCIHKAWLHCANRLERDNPRSNELSSSAEAKNPSKSKIQIMYICQGNSLLS